jgi:hypothetical protein
MHDSPHGRGLHRMREDSDRDVVDADHGTK